MNTGGRIRLSIVVLSAVVGGCAIVPIGDGPGHARVNGVEYTIGVARGIDVSASQMSDGAPIDSADDPGQFAEMTTYQLEGVDPRAFLLAPANSVHDDGGPLGPYLALWGPGDPFPAVCRYFPDTLGTRPTEC